MFQLACIQPLRSAKELGRNYIINVCVDIGGPGGVSTPGLLKVLYGMIVGGSQDWNNGDGDGAGAAKGELRCVFLLV